MCETIIRTAVIGMGNMGSQYAALLAAGAVPGMALAGWRWPPSPGCGPRRWPPGG